MINMRKLLQLELADMSADLEAAETDLLDDKLTRKAAELKKAEKPTGRCKSESTPTSNRRLTRSQDPFTTKNIRHPAG